MRAAVVAATGIVAGLLGAGCGKPAAVPVEAERPVAGKIDGTDLVRHYRSGTPHELEGKYVQIRLVHDVMFAPDGEGVLCFVWESREGYRRPSIVGRTAKKYTPPESGKESTFGRAVIVGKLTGLVAVQSRPSLALWAKSPPGEPSLGENVIVLEDCLLRD